jgi:hypothetical protein
MDSKWETSRSMPLESKGSSHMDVKSEEATAYNNAFKRRRAKTHAP